MSKPKQLFIERHEGGERAVLVHVDFYPQHDVERQSEFKELAISAGLEILTFVTAKKDRPEPRYYVGKGKAEELLAAVRYHDADVVVFNHELTPAQGRNLEKLCDCRVVTRSELILDIFAQRARTYEGKLQVELAQLQHVSTRLVRGWTHLERQKGGIGLRGPGETQLENDRRLISVRIKNIKNRLEKVLQSREQGRRSRKKSQIPTVSLVGYTNAGKSTLFNALTHSDIYAADKLFATLDPTLRNLFINGMGSVVLADTVGFIRDLPHDLVAAFRATLEETRQADLLLHVVDVSSPNYQETIDEVNFVLKEIGADHVSQLLVFNKIDLLERRQPRIDYAADGLPARAWVSAAKQQGLDNLIDATGDYVGGQLLQRTVRLDMTRSKLRSELYSLKLVEEEIIDGDQWVLKLKIRDTVFRHYFG